MHEDFRPMSDAEFRERFPKTEPDPPQERSPQRTHNDIAHRSAALCWRIRNTFKPEEWAGQIEAADEGIRECLREHMRQAWRELQDRKRREAGKQTPAGDAAMAELRAKVLGKHEKSLKTLADS